MAYVYAAPATQEPPLVNGKEPKTTSRPIEMKRDCEKAKTALTRKAPKIELFIHGVALATIALLAYFNFTDYFWQEVSNETDVLKKDLHLTQNSALKALQYAAKLHEILMQASLSALALYYAHKLMVGSRGIPLGLIDTPYNGGSPGMLRHYRFWETRLFRSQYRLFALFLLVASILSISIGPSSAILMIPSLDWWPVNDPFRGQPMTT
jgi:hypothetical protein